MAFGKVIGEKLATDPTFLPSVPRHSMFEYELGGSFKKLPLIGFIDSYEPHTSLVEYKTGRRPWDQKRADTHGQFDMYLLMLYLTHKVKPEDVALRLVWLPTQANGDFSVSLIKYTEPVIFNTKRTMSDILAFGSRILRVKKEMEEFVARYPQPILAPTADVR